MYSRVSPPTGGALVQDLDTGDVMMIQRAAWTEIIRFDGRTFTPQLFYRGEPFHSLQYVPGAGDWLMLQQRSFFVQLLTINGQTGMASTLHFAPRQGVMTLERASVMPPRMVFADRARPG